jgi:hypothetical protein
MRLIRVEMVIYIVLAAYASLVWYELWLLQRPFDVMNL